MDTLDVMMKKYISEQQADLYNGQIVKESKDSSETLSTRLQNMTIKIEQLMSQNKHLTQTVVTQQEKVKKLEGSSQKRVNNQLDDL